MKVKLPTKLKIDDVEYSVVQKTGTALQDQEKRADMFYYGLTVFEKSTIYINSELSDKQKQLTLIHEMIHAILHERGHDDLNDANCDGIVDGLAHGIRLAIQQNDLDDILKGENQQ